MSSTRSLWRAATAALILSVAATPLLAGPSAPTPVMDEQLSGTRLTVTPRVGFESAVLRVSGPDGYTLSKQFGNGAPISVDLLTDAEPVETLAGAQVGRLGSGLLADGKYHYEIALTAAAEEEVQHSGMFFVRGGVAAARSSVRADLHTARGKLAADRQQSALDGPEPQVLHNLYVAILDQQVGTTALNLDSENYSQVTHEVWSVTNNDGTLHVAECGTSHYGPFQTGGCERYVMSFPDDSSGRVGIGTSAPLEELHIDSSDGADLRLSGSGADWVVGILASSNQLILRDAANNASVVRLNQGAPGSSLVIAADGRIGVRTDVPEGDFHLTNADGSGDTVFKIARSGTGSWNLGHTGTGVFTFNKSGTGGQEFTVRNRNHAVATLDVQGHVRGTTFKNSSSRKLKTGFEAVDSAEILQKVSELPVTSWRYRDDDTASKHIGPVAEDFQRLFGLGDEETISTIDIDGVALAAIQGLTIELEEKERRLAILADQLAEERKAKDAQIEDLNERLAAIEARLASVVDGWPDT